MKSTRKLNFLGPADVEAAVSEIAEMAAEQGAKIALVGGVAMAAYGSDRLTSDVDVASNLLLVGISHPKRLSFGGVSGRSPSGHPVDIIVRDDAYMLLYEEAIDSSHDVGLPVPVVLPSYLAALKMAAARPKDEEDLRSLIRMGLDRPSARLVIKRYLGEYAAREFDSICDEIDWQSSREK